MRYINRLQFQTKDVAQILNVDIKKVKKLTEKYGGHWYKMGDRWFIHRLDLQQVLRSMKKSPDLIRSKDSVVWPR
jgi:hypothetical protein